MKRMVASLIVATLLTGGLAGCASDTKKEGSPTPAGTSGTTSAKPTDTPAEKVKISMSGWLEAEEATAGIFKELIADFETKYPNIDVETVAIPFNQYKDQVLIASSSQNTADVIMGNSQMMAAFNGAGALAPLGDLVSKDVVNDIFPNNLEGTTFDGKIMALSWAPHPIAMFYNKDLFKQAGLDPEVAPKTWDEMIAAAEEIAKLGKDAAGNQIYGIALPNAKVAHTGTVFNGLIYTYGGQYQDASGEIVFDNAGTKEAYQFMKDMTDQGVMPAGLEIKDIRGLFAAGSIGITFDGDMGRNNFRKLSGKGEEFDKIMGVAIIPTHKTGKSETVYTEHELAISANSKNPKEAALLIEYLLSQDAMVKYHKSNAVLSARKSIAALPEMNEDDYMKVFNKQSETASPLPAKNPFFDNAMLEVTKSIERVVIGKEAIDTVVPETSAKIAQMYESK